MNERVYLYGQVLNGLLSGITDQQYERHFAGLSDEEVVAKLLAWARLLVDAAVKDLGGPFV